MTQQQQYPPPKQQQGPQSPPSPQQQQHGSVGIYDLFFDLPHPAASPACERARVIEAPSGLLHISVGELFEPRNVSRIARFAFPEYDDQKYDQSHSFRLSNAHGLPQRPLGNWEGSANLNRYDVYLQAFTPQQHTFALQLSDGTRIHGHVRRYLPTRADVKFRADIGRRGARAMVLLTRATGGERFFASVLKTVETIIAAADTVSSDLHKDETPARTFLHTLHNRHAKLCSDQFFASGGVYIPHNNINNNDNNAPGSDAQSVNSSTLASAGSVSGASQQQPPSASDMAKLFVEKTGNFFKIQLPMIEFGPSSDIALINETYTATRTIAGDFIRFQLPSSLQPCYENLGPYSMMEDMHSPILPLIRCIGAPHLLRLLSALLCERRVIMVSSSTSRLSACVRAASSLLSQGLLVWRHIHIPVLPPHLLNYILAQQPYIIGILETHASNLDTVPGLANVLCVYLDRNELRTYNMDNPDFTIPDLLKQTNRRSSVKKGSSSSTESLFNVSELLAKDLDEILKADRRMWGQDEKGNKDKNNNLGNSANSVGPGGSTVTGGDYDSTLEPNRDLTSSQRTSFLTRFLSKRAKSNLSSNDSSGIDPLGGLTHEERRHSPDAAAFFGKIMRASRQYPKQSDQNDSDSASCVGNDDSSTSHEYLVQGQSNYFAAAQQQQQQQATMGEIGSAFSTIEPCSTCENERGEEEIRAALVSFYLYIYGDMGMYLSESPRDGTLWLDRRKFLLRKKQMGDREDTPMFTVLRLLSGSLMFEHFVRGRIAELEQTRSERMRIMPHHIPLFAMCEKFMIVNRLVFSIGTIRRVVSKTIVSCPQHSSVEATERVRAIALALTSNQSYEGNVTAALAELVNDCREVDSALCHVMAVIWSRLGETRSNLWKRPLLALHLLKNLLLHGPITAVIEANDGIDKIRALRKYANSKHSDSIREVCTAANHVYGLLIDRTCLFLRRKRVACGRALPSAFKLQTSLRWSDYLVRRLPVTVKFQHLHLLLRPKESDSLPVMRQPAKESNPISMMGIHTGISQMDSESSSPIISMPSESIKDLTGRKKEQHISPVGYEEKDSDVIPSNVSDYEGENVPGALNGSKFDLAEQDANAPENDLNHDETESDIMQGNDYDYRRKESEMRGSDSDYSKEKSHQSKNDSDYDEKDSDFPINDSDYDEKVSDVPENDFDYGDKDSGIPENDSDSVTDFTMDEEMEQGIDEQRKEEPWMDHSSHSEESEETQEDESQTEEMMDMLAFFNSTMDPQVASPSTQEYSDEVSAHDPLKLYPDEAYLPMADSSVGNRPEIELKWNEPPIDINELHLRDINGDSGSSMQSSTNNSPNMIFAKSSEALKTTPLERTDEPHMLPTHHPVNGGVSEMDSQDWDDQKPIDINELHMKEINDNPDPSTKSSSNDLTNMVNDNCTEKALPIDDNIENDNQEPIPNGEEKSRQNFND